MNTRKAVEAIEAPSLKIDLPVFSIGDTVDVHYLIKEGAKERIQIFNGTVIADKHGGTSRTITVRRIVAGQGVERTYPINSPRIKDIQVKRRGKVRRAKLYYLRDRVGKATKVKELIVKGKGKGKSQSKKNG